MKYVTGDKGNMVPESNVAAIVKDDKGNALVYLKTPGEYGTTPVPCIVLGSYDSVGTVRFVEEGEDHGNS